MKKFKKIRKNNWDFKCLIFTNACKQRDYLEIEIKIYLTKSLFF